MITEKQREEHSKYIGGSMAPAVLGLSRWSTPLQAWAELTGEIERTQKEGLHLTLGNRLEEVVAELFTEKTGIKLRRANETIFHKDYPFLGGNIDRAVVGKREGFEAKTASAWKAKEWEGEEIPAEYIIQCHHYLAVTGWERWHLGVLIGNQDFQIRTIERDEQLLKDMVAKEVAFWKLVETKTMPVTITARDSDTLYSLYPVAKPVTLELGDEVAKLAEQRAAYIADAKLLESEIDRVENIMKSYLGDAEAATAGRYVLQWKNQKQDRLDQKRLALEQPELVAKYRSVTEFRRFEAKIPKGGKK